MPAKCLVLRVRNWKKSQICLNLCFPVTQHGRGDNTISHNVPRRSDFKVVIVFNGFPQCWI